ncbi:MAG: rhomboid family intramembrane serine protease [Actinomycetota bacterium]|jgi:membrane associated rhomboid family serine protease|nr:rhomboid family intramembrane serine protease [Actinomycetota bacterium]
MSDFQGADIPADRPGLADRLVLTLLTIGGVLVLMWGIEIVDTILDDRLEGGGIHPRRLDGLDGILWAPVLHAGFAHLFSNTVPFAVLGLLVMGHGRSTWWKVTISVALVGGGLVWLLGGGGNHIGASGVVFGYLGFLVGAALFGRSVRAFGLALVAVVLYGGLVWGFLPRRGVSWEGHFFGATVGAAAAYVLLRRRYSRADDV